MDRKKAIVERAHECFRGRFVECAQWAREDRQRIAVGEEPDHIRGVMGRIIREAAAVQPEDVGVAMLEEVDFGLGAGEPDIHRQIEAIGHLLEAGATAVEKTAASESPDLTARERVGLECLYLMYGRPSLLVRHGRLTHVPPSWSILDEHREGIEMCACGVGRIELLGHPEYDWAGTGFLASETCLLTSRHTAELFAEGDGMGNWQFRPGISAWMDYRSLYRPGTMAGYRLVKVTGVHDRYDLAMLEVEPPPAAPGRPMPLTLTTQAPPQVEGRPVYCIGYPIRDPRRSEPEFIARIFRDVYNVKRVMPGQLCGMLSLGDVQLLQHDCGPLGNGSGCCIVDLETHQVLGVNVSSRYLETATAIPTWTLCNDPLLKGNVRFAEAADQQLQDASQKLQRLASSRFWADTRAAIDKLFQRAFDERETETS